MAGNKARLGDKGKITGFFFYIGQLIFNNIINKYPMSNSKQ